VPLAQGDEVVGTLAPDRSEQPFREAFAVDPDKVSARQRCDHRRHNPWYRQQLEKLKEALVPKSASMAYNGHCHGACLGPSADV
jgi:hypothetical protein